MFLNLYEVIYIACIDVYYSQIFVVWFQYVHKTLQVAPWHIFLGLRPPPFRLKGIETAPFSSSDAELFMSRTQCKLGKSFV